MFHGNLTSGEAGPVRRALKLDFDFPDAKITPYYVFSPLHVHRCKCISVLSYLDPHPHVIVHYVCAMATMVFMMSIL
ncbi:uncharacterized protein RSE6_08986 [Rhynchosporium secalis]|uniref:Uncharacterized protein n=1 Tax=Rhynchosporium secalis TaxID=38038 RepID=A0A1E1MGS8_RHYSE|nr:uncharacterized protein RSE6_08986 [Rhynchosporium secalis]